MRPVFKGALRFLGILFLLGLVVLAVVGIIQSGKTAEKTETTAAFSFDPYSENRFTAVGRGLLVSADSGLTLFDEEGTLLFSQTVGYADPLTFSRGKTAAVWSQENSIALMVKETGETVEVGLPGSVLTGRVNEQCWGIFLAREGGSKGVAMVVKPDGQPVYRVRMGSSYPIDADLSPDSGNLALLTLQGEGCHLGIYSLNQETELRGWTGEDEIFFEAEYLGGNTLLLLSTEKALFLDEKCQPVGEFAFDGEFLKDYAVSGEGFVVLALGRHRNGSAARLLTLDRNGRELASLDIQGEVEGLSAAGHWISVLYQDRMALYDPDLQEKGHLENASGVQASLVREDGSAIVVAGGSATVFQP